VNVHRRLPVSTLTPRDRLIFAGLAAVSFAPVAIGLDMERGQHRFIRSRAPSHLHREVLEFSPALRDVTELAAQREDIVYAAVLLNDGPPGPWFEPIATANDARARPTSGELVMPDKPTAGDRSE